MAQLPALNVELSEDEQLCAPDAEFEASARLLLQIGKALLLLGAPAYRVEDALNLVSSRLGLLGDFSATPTTLWAALGDEDEQRIYMIRSRGGEPNLRKLSELHLIVEELAEQRLSLRSAIEKIDAIIARDDQLHPLETVAAFALTSAALLAFFLGSWHSILAAGVVGLQTGVLALAAERSVALGRVFVPLAATLGALLAATLCASLNHADPIAVTLAGLIVLVPGLPLTVATRELAVGDIVSGSARLAGAVVTLFTLAFGVALGSELGARLFEFQAPEIIASPDWVRWPALLVFSFTLTMLFRASWKDLPWVLIGCVVAAAGTELGRTLLGPQLGPFLAAFLVAACGNLLSIWRNRAASTVHYPGLLLLVPGSLGFRSLTALLQDDVYSGVQTAFAAVLVAVAIATGFIIASVVVPPRSEI